MRSALCIVRRALCWRMLITPSHREFKHNRLPLVFGMKWVQMHSCLLCLKSISGCFKFVVNSNSSPTLVASISYDVLSGVCEGISGEKPQPNADVCPQRSVAGAKCFHRVLHCKDTPLSFIQTWARKLQARCVPQLNPRRDTLKRRMPPKYNFGVARAS